MNEYSQKKHRENWKSVRETNEFVEKQCPVCGKTFVLNFMVNTRLYCCNSCGGKAAKRVRRARKKASVIETFSFAQVCERDNWICGICGKKINKRLKYPNPMSVSLDHIIPLALGGTHERRNVQPAHLSCNSRKGATCNDQLLLFG